MLLAACQRLGAGAGRMAIDLGCGDGTDTLALLDRGWSVLAVDIEPAGLALLRSRIPPAHLIHAGFSLPFCPSSRFPALWEQIRRALVPAAIFAGQLFGTRDSWAADPGMTFQDRSEITRLLDGLQVLELHEAERDGEAYSGPKHWHTYDILARQPAGHAHPGD